MIEQGQLFLDSKGEVWVTTSPAGTGEYEWWCRHDETDYRTLFKSDYIKERVKSYQENLKELEIQKNMESIMFNVVKEIAKDIVTNESSYDEWSDIELKAIQILSKGQFVIEMDVIE